MKSRLSTCAKHTQARKLVPVLFLSGKRWTRCPGSLEFCNLHKHNSLARSQMVKWNVKPPKKIPTHWNTTAQTPHHCTLCRRRGCYFPVWCGNFLKVIVIIIDPGSPMPWMSLCYTACTQHSVETKEPAWSKPQNSQSWEEVWVILWLLREYFIYILAIQVSYVSNFKKSSPPV